MISHTGPEGVLKQFWFGLKQFCFFGSFVILWMFFATYLGWGVWGWDLHLADSANTFLAPSLNSVIFWGFSYVWKKAFKVGGGC